MALWAVETEFAGERPLVEWFAGKATALECYERWCSASEGYPPRTVALWRIRAGTGAARLTELLNSAQAPGTVEGAAKYTSARYRACGYCAACRAERKVAYCSTPICDGET